MSHEESRCPIEWLENVGFVSYVMRDFSSLLHITIRNSEALVGPRL